MIYLLDNVCNDPAMGNILSIIKDSLGLIQIIGPILALIGITICIIKLITNPDEKKYKKALTNSIIALVIMFFVPIIVNLTMNLLDENLEIASCWQNAKRTDSNSTYIKNTNKKPSSVITDPGTYEKGDAKHAKSSNSANSANVKKLLAAAKEVTAYVKDKGFSYGDAPINPAMDDSARLTSCDRCVAWFLYKVGYTDQPRSHGLVVYDASGERDLSTYLANKGFKKITDQSKIQAGDVMFVSPSNGHPGHTYLLGNKVSDGVWERYDCGSQTRLQSNQPFKEGIGSFMYAYRLPNA